MASQESSPLSMEGEMDTSHSRGDIPMHQGLWLQPLTRTSLGLAQGWVCGNGEGPLCCPLWG